MTCLVERGPKCLMYSSCHVVISAVYMFSNSIVAPYLCDLDYLDHETCREYSHTQTHELADQDLVAQSPKCLLLYKRTSHRVIINRLGDLLVRPRPIEASLRTRAFSGSLQQHLLASYAQSIASILVSQFRPIEGSKASMSSVLQLVKNNFAFRVSLAFPNSCGMTENFAALGCKYFKSKYIQIAWLNNIFWKIFIVSSYLAYAKAAAEGNYEERLVFRTVSWFC